MIESSVQMITRPAVKVIVLLVLGFNVGVSLAQPEVNSEPASDTEIICFAAQSKWVCAPADQRQQAHDKAMKLIKENESASLDSDLVDNAQVEIKTMDVNNDFSQQVKELSADQLSPQDLVRQQTSDFESRDVMSDPQEPNTDLPETVVDSIEEESAEVLAAQNSNQPDEHVTKPVQQHPDDSNDFTYWQSNYPDGWSFQVIGTSNRHHLNEFIDSHGLQQSKHTIIKTKVNSADWWIVLVGLYASRDEALSQRDQLPSKLATEAWVRQIKSIIGQAD